MEKRNNLVNIHKFIGNKNYNKLFGKKLDFYRLTQRVINEYYQYNITSVNMEFSEAILVICNSFQILAQENNDLIYLLAGKDEPFYFVNYLVRESKFLTDYQKNFYEMIFNYKYYYEEFNNINDQLKDIINSKFRFMRIFIYIYLTFNTILLLFICSLMYLFNISFEFIIMKIINYINMLINVKNDEFNFIDIFFQKIENLEAILQFYNINPIKTIQNLNSIYIKYQQYLSSRNKNNAINSNKKNYKRTIEDKKNEIDNVPKNHKIVMRTDIKSFGITSKYGFIYYFNLILIIGLYILLIIQWKDYFKKRDKLSTLNQKNTQLEMTLYKAINGYHLMIINDFSLSEISEIVILDKTKINMNFWLFQNFFENLKLAFNNKIEEDSLGGIYQNFDVRANFTCENIYNMSKEFIIELANYTQESDYLNILNHLIILCEKTEISVLKDYRTIFERHLQYIKNEIMIINNFNVVNKLYYIINDERSSIISLFFYNVVVYILQIAYYFPYEISISKLNNILIGLIEISEIIFLLFDLIATLFFIFFYIPGINNLCEQIFTLKKVFKIFEVSE